MVVAEPFEVAGGEGEEIQECRSEGGVKEVIQERAECAEVLRSLLTWMRQIALLSLHLMLLQQSIAFQDMEAEAEDGGEEEVITTGRRGENSMRRAEDQDSRLPELRMERSVKKGRHVVTTRLERVVVVTNAK